MGRLKEFSTIDYLLESMARLVELTVGLSCFAGTMRCDVPNKVVHTICVSADRSPLTPCFLFLKPGPKKGLDYGGRKVLFTSLRWPDDGGMSIMTFSLPDSHWTVFPTTRAA